MSSNYSLKNNYLIKNINITLNLFQMGMAHGPSDMSEDEPMAKKLRTEETLIPEDQFLALHKVCSFF